MNKLVLSLLCLMTANAVSAEKYNLDTSHSEVGFSVTHLMVSKVKGHFKKYNASFSFDQASGEVTDIDVNIDPATIYTNEDKRDDHLRGADFFDVKKFPAITFKADKVKVTKGQKTMVTGQLSMHGVSKPASFDLEYSGSVIDPWKNEKLGFSLVGKINRKDWGLTWNKGLDKGGVAVGDEVTISVDGEAQKVAAPAAASKKGK